MQGRLDALHDDGARAVERPAHETERELRVTLLVLGDLLVGGSNQRICG